MCSPSVNLTFSLYFTYFCIFRDAFMQFFQFSLALCFTFVIFTFAHSGFDENNPFLYNHCMTVSV